MTIAIAAGKGGTGKTLLATSLAQALALEASEPVTLIDCDVEEPNAHVLLHPIHEETTEVSIPQPVVDTDKCTACGLCAQHCQFSAIAVLRGTVLTFPDLCAGCGVCSYVCPVGAITEVPRSVGVIVKGLAPVSTAAGNGRVRFIQGRTHVGQQRSTPVIKAAKQFIDTAAITLLDAPPGTACPMQETVEDADYCILVTEPTPFGLHDLASAVETCRAFGVPCGVVINRDGIGSSADVEKYCADEGLAILWRVQHMREIAEAYSRGQTLLAAKPEMKTELLDLFTRVQEDRDAQTRQTA